MEAAQQIVAALELLKNHRQNHRSNRHNSFGFEAWVSDQHSALLRGPWNHLQALAHCKNPLFEDLIEAIQLMNQPLPRKMSPMENTKIYDDEYYSQADSTNNECV